MTLGSALAVLLAALALVAQGTAHERQGSAKRVLLAAAPPEVVAPRNDSAQPARVPILAVVNAYKDDIAWLLAEDDGRDRWRPIVETVVYQVADIAADCSPHFPGLPRVIKPGTITPLPGWPRWAQNYVDHKCKALTEATILPGSVQDAERTARMQAGLLQPADRGNATSDPSPGEGAGIEAKGEPERGPVVVMPSLSPLPLHIVPNHGSESMGYLTAILDHWEHLPDLMLFLHGHRQSWHTFALGSDFALRRLAKLPPRNLSAGFMQLGCLELPDHANRVFPRVMDANHFYSPALGPRWHESFAAHYMQAWLEPGGLGGLFGEALPPPYIQAACCASFAVSREAILRRPRPFYEALRTWLLTTPMERYWSGVILEFTFHMAFTGRAVYDPPVEQCRAELYDM